MSMITDTQALAAFCDTLSTEAFVTVDTEFMREKTYWPQLCVVQLGGTGDARAVDVLAPGIDLAPLFELLKNENVLKVFHAARQDVEIFVKLMGETPRPMFDTQVAAMVCGFGEQAGYEALVNGICKKSLDKSSRFTDWARRPLTDKQITYALGDVTYLRDIYEHLSGALESSGRAHWLDEEMAILLDVGTYVVEPMEAWKRLKPRPKDPKAAVVLQAVAAWREREAQGRDVPRNRIIRDEALQEISHQKPKDTVALERVRGISKGTAEGKFGRAILEAVQQGINTDPKSIPRPPRKPDIPRGLGPVVDLLRVLLKMKCETEGVAQKMIANAEVLEHIAAFGEKADVPAMTGWRRELFGEDALKLRNGEIGLAVSGTDIKVLDLNETTQGA